jgi:hypothetical protein
MRRILALAAVLAAAGCASQHELATCHGPLVALNAAHWQPSAAEMTALAKACPEDK